MKVEVDMEKISADISAAEEAARKRIAEREKDTGERGAREAPACVLAEEEKHVCATHGNKSQQNSLSDSNHKEGEESESNPTEPSGETCHCHHWLMSGSLNQPLLPSLCKFCIFTLCHYCREAEGLRSAGGSRRKWGGGVRGQGKCSRGSHGGGNQWQQHRLRDHLGSNGRRPNEWTVRGAQ